MAHLEYVTLIVRDYDPAIRFFIDLLEFDLVEDVPSFTNDGRPKRWVVVRPRNSITGILLARADGAPQMAAAGQQAAGVASPSFYASTILRPRMHACSLRMLLSLPRRAPSRTAWSQSSAISKAIVGICWGHPLTHNARCCSQGHGDALCNCAMLRTAPFIAKFS